MTVGLTQKGGNLVAEIAAWSIELPAWQQDALRRIVEHGSLSSQDLDQLTWLCKKEHGPSDCSLMAQPVNQDSIPNGSPTAQTVTLRSIAEPEHVNALDGKQELTFEEQGVTIIFGYNGSGKSGYGRILRRACRARAKGAPILPNVTNSAETGPASAVITYAFDGIEQQPEQWIDAQRAVAALGSVSFFDAQCATVHVGDKNDIAFTSFGLDLLPKLGAACKEVQKRLDDERQTIESLRPAFFQTAMATGDTEVGKLLRILRHNSPLEKIDSLALLSDDDRRRQQELTFLLANDGGKQVQEIRGRVRRLTALGQTLADALQALSPGAVEALKALATDYQTKSMAAEAAAKVAFSDDPLPGVGEPVWRELWEAARKYSSQAYPDELFPVVDGDGPVCVLCQQPLNDDGKNRLARFERFVADDTAIAAATAKDALKRSIDRLESLSLSDRGLKEQLKDLQLASPDLLPYTRSIIASLLRQIRAIRVAQVTGDWLRPKGISADDCSPRLQVIIDRLVAQEVEIERAVNLEERRKIEVELHGFRAREWLATVLADIKIHVQRLEDLQKLNRCVDATKTNKLTAKSKALAKAHIADKVRDVFASEIQHMRLGVRRLNVELNAAAGELGSSYYRIQLVGATNAKIAAVVSEGEHRCIALAGFLAELATEPSKSAVVFDDPVSSLDHLWRERFARRLVKEAASRQVIVFTHDVVFLHDLISIADQEEISCALRRVHADRERCGVVTDDLPWVAQSTLQRIDGLEKSACATRAHFDAQDDDAYAREICQVYSDLRATIERAVEECFFRGVVLRRRDYVNLKDLRLVTAVTLADCERAQKLFQRCCNVTSAHDRPMPSNFCVPTPDEALVDIGELRSLVDELKERQKATS